MIQRYFMRLSYNGAPFHGWQSQPNAVSVQSVLEEGLSRVFRVPVKITGAGRTDTGVNASLMVAHFDLEIPHREIDARLMASLNSLVGKDIAVQSISPVHRDAHARFDATSRTYYYYTHSLKSPFLYAHSWQEPPDLDFETMNECGRILLDTNDFTSFANRCQDQYMQCELCGMA